ncbi:MAG: C25 family cysteine peptidase, partial [Candidatus Thorarchaeota archaeon]
MKKVGLNRRVISLKLISIIVAAMIVISPATMSIVKPQTSPEDVPVQNHIDQSFQSRTSEATSVLAQEGLWITADSSLEGTSAEAHVTVSDTSGITIVADFHGFWLDNRTIDSASYYVLNMPGATSLREYGKPELPCLFEYVQIPHDVDIEIDVQSTTSANVSEYISAYEIKPGPFPEFPNPIADGEDDNSSTAEADLHFDPVYSDGTVFPGIETSTEGELNATSLIMRGHRLLGLSFYPLQYSNSTKELILYSQLIIKVKYSFSAQIESVPENLRSSIFEKCINQTILNCPATEFMEYVPGFSEEPLHVPPYFLYAEGAEYLIITTEELKAQADRLADWKERKGLLSKVYEIPNYVRLLGDDYTKQHLKNYLKIIYNTWYPAPTYVLLFGDVEHIPTNYDMDHNGGYTEGITTTRFFEEGHSKVASDFGYFNIDGNGYFPDMIYSRISVDTELEAEVIVNKTLRYEQSPTTNTTFYENFLNAGYFQDYEPADYWSYGDSQEDEDWPMIYTLERIRHYLNDTLRYNAHINYSAAINERPPLNFWEELDGSDLVDDSIGRNNYFPNFAWLEGYDWSRGSGRFYYYELERYNITPNFNQGRFLVLYMGHGGSRNMYNPENMLEDYSDDMGLDPPEVDFRDLVEGWWHPFLNTSYFADLTNEDMTPLIINIACNTGWFDGETDQEVLYPENFDVPGQNPFADYSSECFAENITRLEGGGAIAVIASSRQAYIPISKHLLDGLVQAFWPGFLGSKNQPIYEMGGALLFGKIYAVSEHTVAILEEHDQRQLLVEEYHLFGDPETQLWTDVPTGLIVTYPDQIGIGAQEFVVTVIANSSIPSNYSIGVPNAKVCLQKGSDVYQVGYTDSNGQVVFNVHPGYPGMMNLTVTTHNYIPHIGEMECVCGAPKLTLTPEEGESGTYVRFDVSGFFGDEDVEISYEYYHITTLPGGASRSVTIPTIRYGFGNIIAIGVDSNLVAVAVYRIYIRDPRPDPYIWSQWDESTWERVGVTGDDIGWENPDIMILDGFHPVSPGEKLSPSTSYIIRIWVRNRDAVAWNTKVTLRYAPIGGGVTWDWAGEDYIHKIIAG